jgi:hypothetical protein
MADIQRSIRQKDEEMSWLDACCLHFAIKGKTKTETYTFQTRDPNVKKEWIVGKYAINVNKLILLIKLTNFHGYILHTSKQTQT